MGSEFIIDLKAANGSEIPYLRTTVSLVCYIRNSLRFWYYASLSTCFQNLEKNWGHQENLGESGGQIFKGCDREKCQF